MTNYNKCPYCGAIRMLYQVLDGKRIRICFNCFKVQRRVTVPASRAKAAALSVVLIGSLVAGPVWAEQIVLDGQEFRAHVARDQALQSDRENLAQQNALYRQNETNYKQVVQRLKELQAKTDEKAAAQASLIATYDEKLVQMVEQQKELAEEVRRVKQEQASLTWEERGKGFAAGMLAVGAVAVYLLRGGR
jgi:DNA repair exonuclease SbcCD ATPase subunit